MAWRVARSLETLRGQIDERYPNRSRISDGTIGDADHQNRQSDHNPWYGPGIVTALDITHDPKGGVDIDKLTDELQASRDPRIKYVIANRLIMSGQGGPSPWVWRGYSGSNPHTRHMHVSVVASPLCDDPRPWNLPSLRGTTGGGGGAAPGGDDMPLSTDDLRRMHDAVWHGVDGGKLISVREPGKPNGWAEYVLGSMSDWIVRQQLAPLRAQVGELVRLVGQREAVTAEDIAAALRAGLTADLLPVLQEVVGEALGEDNTDQANQIADSVLDRLSTRLQEGSAA